MASPPAAPTDRQDLFHSQYPSQNPPPFERRPYIPDTDAPSFPSFGPDTSHPTNRHTLYTVEAPSPRPYNSFPSRSSPRQRLQEEPLYQDYPTEYSREISEFEEERPDGYHLVERDQQRSFHRMDMDVERIKEKDQKLKRNIRRFRFVVRSLHLGCSLVVVSLLAANFAVFNRTQDHIIVDPDDGPEPAWQGTKSWPAIVLLIVASISALISIVVLLSYFKSVAWANRLATINGIMLISASLIFIAVWAISAGLFRHNLNATDGFNIPNIWSWSCSHEDASDSVVNFKQICLTQNWSFVCAMIEITLECLTIGSFLLIIVRRRSKKNIRRSEAYASFMKNQYAQGPLQGYVQPTPPMPYEPLPSARGECPPYQKINMDV